MIPVKKLPDYQQPKAADVNNVIDRVNSLSKVNSHSGINSTVSPLGVSVLSSQGGGGGTVIRIFEVQSAAAGDGVYNCYRQSLDATEWTDTAGDDKLDDYDTTSIEALNLMENNPEAGYVAQLVATDRMACWQMLDDEGNLRWVGIPIEQNFGVRKAYCNGAAGAATTIAAFLDVDTTGAGITVTCSVVGGGNLNSAIPRLADGSLIFVTNIGGTWYCTTVFQTSEDCACS